MTRRIYALLAVAALAPAVLAGCGGTGASADTTTISTAPWTKKEAGEQYLRMVAKGNKYYEAWKGKTLAPVNIQDYAKGYVARTDLLVRDLAEGRWPASVKADVTRLIRGWNSVRADYVAVAKAKTQDEAWTRWGAARPEPAGPAADIRTRLGLPPPS